MNKKISTFSLKIQLSILVSLGVSTIIIISFLFIYSLDRDSIVDTEISRSVDVLEDASFIIDLYLDEIESLSLIPWQNNTFTNIIFANDGSFDDEDNEIITRQLYEFAYVRDDIKNIKMYLENKDKLIELKKSEAGTFVTTSDYYDFDNLYFKKMIEDSGNFCYIEKSPENENEFIFYRGIIDIATKEVVCILQFTFNDLYLDAYLNNESNKNSKTYLILNDEIVYSNTDMYLDFKDIDYGKYYYNLYGEEYLEISTSSNKYNYELVSFRESSDIRDLLTTRRNLCIGVAIVIIISCFSCILFFTNKVTKPLYELENKFKDVAKGDYKSKIHINGSSEIVHLAKSFNYMTNEIEKHIDKTYIAEINEKNAKLIALEAQINPHFLYNVLQVISAEAISNDQYKIYEMVSSLALMLRYTIKNNDTVSVSEELDHVRQYMIMQKYRFGSNLEYTISIDKLTKKDVINIPKLSIQTIVENCIEHGMKSIEYTLMININIYSENCYTFIEIMDNGNGIPEYKLQKLQELFNNWNSNIISERKHIGILNLYSRLRLLYEDRGCYTIINIKPSGTLSIIKIPESDSHG